MRTLTGQSISNIDTSNPAEFPYGRAKNESVAGAKDGTPLREEVTGIGDIYQAILHILDAAGITPNENEEKDSNKQILTAFETLYIRRAFEEGIPVAIITVIGGSIVNTYGKGIGTPTLTDVSSNPSQTRLYNLNIVESGNYVVTCSMVTPLTAGSPAYPVTIAASHTGAGIFQNNTAGNISIASDPAVTDYNNVPDDFVMTIYKES